MTELEKQLLSALEQLQQDYSQRLDEWESAFAEWRSMWAYATGERGAERARVGLEHAGAEFKRAAAPLVRELNAIELRQRENEYQKTLELERQPQKTYRGPTL
jgi:exonuclease VII large subunit